MNDKPKKTPKALNLPADLPGFAPSDLAALMKSLERLNTDPGDEALDRAQDKAFEAMEAPTARKRVALAKAALALSPLCADAYLVLAWEAKDASAALDLVRKAVAAGAEAVGEAAFQNDVGEFWLLLQTRPYMRARYELASCLWDAGEHDAAIGHYQDLLRLNPNDNQGVRYPLLDALLDQGRDQDAAELLKLYKHDASAAWAWSAVLLAFRRTGDRAAARKALSRALSGNPHVPAYLFGTKPLPAVLPEFISLGEDDEAVAYVHDAVAAWTTTPNALAWLKGVLEKHAAGPKSKRTESATEIDTDRIDDAVLALLLLGLHQGERAWKTFDWEAMDRLHRKGMISNPVGAAKSVVLTEVGLKEAKALHSRLFEYEPASRS